MNGGELKPSMVNGGSVHATTSAVDKSNRNKRCAEELSSDKFSPPDPHFEVAEEQIEEEEAMALVRSEKQVRSHFQYWKRKMEAIRSLKQPTLENILLALEGTPHMDKERQELQASLQVLNESQREHESLLRQEQEIQEQEFQEQEIQEQKRQDLPQWVQRKMAALEQRNAALQQRNAALQQQKAADDQQKAVSDLLTDVTFAAARTENSLLSLSALSQEEGSTVTNTEMANKRKKDEAQIKEQVEQFLKCEPASLSEMYRHILAKPEIFHLFDRSSLLQWKASPRLKAVSDVFVKAFPSRKESFPNRTETSKDDDAFESKMEKTVDTLRSLFKSALENPSEKVKTTATVFFPGPTNREVDGVQPIMTVLLEAIADCCQLESIVESGQNPSSPPKTISEQKAVYGGRSRADRRCDISIWKRGRHLVVMLDGFLQVTFEMKPGQRPGKSILALRYEGRDQDLSHSSKSLLHCLRFANGAGVPSHATSVLGTLVYVEMLQLQLIHPGKANSEIKLLSSGPLPLVSREQFDAWYAADHRAIHEKDLKEMRELLYPSEHCGLDEDGIPLGIKALYRLMECSRQELMGPKWESVSEKLGDLLGTGTFGMVFRHKDHQDEAIKVSRGDWRHLIENEAAILKYLSNIKDRPHSVPQFMSFMLLDVKIGGVTSKLEALDTKPVGREVYSCLKDNTNDPSGIICCILDDISQALEFLHKNGIAHNDVSDRNIVLLPPTDEKQPWRAVLIDFSVACEMYSLCKGLIGSPPFVHREVHQNFEWFPVPQYDKTSLGLTLVVLLEDGMIPWKGLSDKGRKEDNNRSTGPSKKRIIDHEGIESTLEDVSAEIGTAGGRPDNGKIQGKQKRQGEKTTVYYDERLRLASECLSSAEASLDKTVRKRIHALLNLDLESFQTRCGCTKNCLDTKCGCQKKQVPCTVPCGCFNNEGNEFSCSRDSVNPKCPAIRPKRIGLDELKKGLVDNCAHASAIDASSQREP